MKNTPLYFLLFIIFISCSKKTENESLKEADILFGKSVDLICEITRQIEASSDSASIDSLWIVFEKKITEINFSVSPQTDLKLTEQENDSLFFLLQKMKETRYIKLCDFSILKNDSII